MAKTNQNKSGAKLWVRVVCIVLAALMVAGLATTLITWLVSLL